MNRSSYLNTRHEIGRGRRTCAMLGGTLAAAAVIGTLAAGSAQAAPAPTAQLSFDPATISAGTQPQLTFMSQNVPSGTLLYLQESADGGQQWKTIGKTTSTQATANIAALSEGDYEFRILITENNTVLAASAPASLTVTGFGGAVPTPAPTPAGVPQTGNTPAPSAVPSPAPSSSGVPWLDKVVKTVWKAAWDIILAWIFSLF